MSRHRLGAALLVASVLLFPAQVIAALAWPDGYSITRNAISDLGVTTCGEFGELGGQGEQIRQVCSPQHGVFNGAMVLVGAMVAIGSLLIYGYWSTRAGKLGSVLLAVSGLGVLAVGLAPWDVAPDIHDLTALIQAVAQWVAMAWFFFAANSRACRAFTLIALAVSIAGFVAFIAAADGTEVLGLSFGVAERLSFDTLTIWVVVLGLTILRRHPVTGEGRRSNPAAGAEPAR